MAGFDVLVKTCSSYAIIYTDGYINNEGGERVVEECFGLIDRGYHNLILNLEKSKIVNSLGVSLLIEVIERVSEIGGTIAFCELTPTIAKMFKMMGIQQYARVFPHEDEAIRSF